MYHDYIAKIPNVSEKEWLITGVIKLIDKDSPSLWNKNGRHHLDSLMNPKNMFGPHDLMLRLEENKKAIKIK